MTNLKLTYFDRYLKVAPFSLAIWRAIEAGEIAKIKYKRPLLDIGCGFGEFAGVFFESQVEVGIDIAPLDLILARRQGGYKKLFLADARKLPFPDESFATVLSVSVLEHIPKVEKTFQEIFRVLKPGGLLIFTVPTSDLYNCLFYTQLFEKMKLPFLARFYLKLFNLVFKHVNIISKEEWEEMVREASFEVEISQKIISKKATAVFDFFLISALPSQIGRLTVGKRFVWGLRLKNWFFKNFFRQYLTLEDDTGSNIILVARKPKRK